MMTFLIKSTVCLVVLYCFFHFFLQHQKILRFNRFYLIFSMIFSMIIPLIYIPVKSNLTFNNSFYKFTSTTVQTIKGETIIGNSSPFFTFQNISLTLFIIISSILFIRFALNIYNILRKIIKSKKVDYLKISLVLIEEKTLPYSFFRYVFLNRSDFENGLIEKELLIHEEAHCLQYHSIDIMIIELLNVFFWFNPAIWLFRKAILSNHEFYADSKVLTNSNSVDYHQLLLNLIVQNNTNFLVSNFKYSLIKKRLIMMTQSGPTNNAILRKIAAISLFLFLGIAFTFSQDNKLTGNVSNSDNGWWTPILQKHKIDSKQFNFKNAFRIDYNDSLGSHVSCFEMGTFDSLNKRIVSLKNAIFISTDNDDKYVFFTAKSVSHDLDNNAFEAKNGNYSYYKLEDNKPINTRPYQEYKMWKRLVLDAKSQQHVTIMSLID
jgi:hypothetical protein